jgi:hypothetical protein
VADGFVCSNRDGWRHENCAYPIVYSEELSLRENSAIMEEVLKIVEYHYQREVDVDSLTQLGVECLLYQLDSFSHFYSQSHGDQRSLKELLNEDFGISVYWLDDELYYLHLKNSFNK